MSVSRCVAILGLFMLCCAPLVVSGLRNPVHWLKPVPHTECDEPDYRRNLLTIIKEMPFIGLFADIKRTAKYEASGMTVANGWLWVVFDNLHALGRVDEQFQFRDERNLLIGDVGDDSQFEGLTYVKSTGHFLAVEEVSDSVHGLVPWTHELELTDDGTKYRLVQRCHVHFELSHGNKGFEGLHYHEDEDGNKYLFGLCEGNFCEGGKRGRERGNGRIVVTRFNGQQGDECGWDVVKVVHIPSAADFVDYSGMAFRRDRVAIVSQESSAMWVGRFDYATLEFITDRSSGTVYMFPRDHNCQMIFCNVEGVEWLDSARLVIASDKAKKDQPLRCVDHDQRISIFALPEVDEERQADYDDEDDDADFDQALAAQNVADL